MGAPLRQAQHRNPTLTPARGPRDVALAYAPARCICHVRFCFYCKKGHFMLYLYTVLRHFGGGLWHSLAGVSITGQGSFSSIVVAAGYGRSAWRARATTRHQLAYVFRSAHGLRQSLPGGCCIVRAGSVGQGPVSALKHRLKSNLWYLQAGRLLRFAGHWRGWPGSHRRRALCIARWR